MLPDALRVATPLLVGGEGRQLVRPAGWQFARGKPVEQRLLLGVGRRPGGEALLPLRVQRLASLGDLPGVADRLLFGGERDVRVEVQDLLGGLDLRLAERGAVRGAGVLLVGRRPADDRAQRDERRLVGDRLGGLEGVVQVLHVLVVAVGGAPAQPLHVPAVGLVPGGDVLGLGDVRVVLDRDEVVVVEHDQVAQFLVRGQRGDLVADALLDVAVGGEGVDEVIERRGARRGVGVVEAALAAGRHRHAHRVAEALAERARRGLHARGQAVLRMAGGEAAPRAVSLEVVEREAVARQVQLDVERQRRVPAGEHEPVPARPLRVGRVVPEHVLEEDVGGGCQAHRRARVTGTRLLHRVHRQHADQVDGALVRIRPVEGVVARHLS